VTPFTVAGEPEAELVAAGDWYQANARAGVATRFHEAIERAFSELSEAPEAFPVEATRGRQGGIPSGRFSTLDSPRSLGRPPARN
jgi:hypothetical protein